MKKYIVPSIKTPEERKEIEKKLIDAWFKNKITIDEMFIALKKLK